MSTNADDMAGTTSWFRERGWELVVRDRTSDDVAERHRPEVDRGFVWWCDLVSIEHPEILLDGFGIARDATEAVHAARRRWEVEGFRPNEIFDDPEVNDDMGSAVVSEFWAIANAVSDDPAANAWDVLGRAGLESLVVGQWFRPPTTSQRDALVVAANEMYETDEITAEQIDAWVEEVRWRWPTTMQVLWYTETGWTDAQPDWAKD